MVRSVRGRLASLDADGAVIDVGGIGLLLRVSATTARGLPAAGGEVALEATLVVRDDALELYGFASQSEREMFAALTSVNGVGPRMALAICGVLPPDQLRMAIATGDAPRLRAAPGVGPRIAERVVLELRDRIGSANGGSASSDGGGPGVAARDGLASLGFDDAEISQALADAPSDLDAEGLIRHALARLRRG
jgi:Holliday junction DNA helicase RuvA